MDLKFDFAQKILESLGNNHSDNWDSMRFGKELQVEKQLQFPSKVSLLNNMGYFHFEQSRSILKTAYTVFEEYWENLESTYNNLSDQESKNIYVELLSYGVLGYKKVKLSSNNNLRKSYLKKIQNFIDYKDCIKSNFEDRNLYMHRFQYKGNQLSLYHTECGPLNAFFLGQYRLDHNIAPKEGDYIIDCGACWGDSTCEFAASSGDNGKVFAYEFIPKSKEILQNNIDLNPSLSNRIEIIDHAVWSESKIHFFYKDNGPGSRVEMDSFSDHEGKVTTLSIDDLIKQKKINKLDWIKMDIEGAEPHALKGAQQTIKEFKPNLAISIYHNMNDFSNIVPRLSHLNLGYKFYVRHFTIHSEETVLFATVK